MSSVLVGSAYGVLELRAQQFDQGVDASLAKLAQLRQAFSQGIPPVTLPPVGGGLPGPGTPRQLPGGLAPDIQKDEQAMLRYASSLATAQKAQGDLSGAASTYRTVLSQLTPNTIEHNRATAQLASTEAALAKEGIGQVTSGLSSMISPLALATVGFAAGAAAVNSFEEAFKFKAELDQNTASITAQLRGVRDSGQAFAEARVFADRYKLTQEDTTTAIQASVPLLRQSKASLTDVLTVLSKLQVLKPEQGIQGAAFALAELEGGQSRSLATRFNIPIAKATEMKNEIAKGADAVQVLGDYLTKAGIGAEALEAGTRGAAGALRDVARAQEQLKLAQADFAQGPGVAILQEQTTLLTGLTRVLGGGGGIAEGFRTAAINSKAAAAAQNSHAEAVFSGKTQTEAAAAAQQAYNASLQQSADATTPAALAQAAYTNAIRHGATAAQARAYAEAQLPPPVDHSAAAYNAAAAAALYYADAQQRVIARSDGGAFNAYVAGANAAGIATQEAAAKIQFFAQAADLSAQKSALDTAAKDAQQAATNKVAFETTSAADAFLKLNPKLDASQAFAAAAAAGLSPLVAQVVALRIEANKTRAALLGAKLDNQSASALTGSNSEEAQLRASNRATVLADRTAAVTKAQTDAKAADAARTNQLLQTGTAAQVVTERQKEYNTAVKQFGANSKQAIDAQTALIEAQQAAAKEGGRHRVDAAQSTALQLQNVEENSQAQLLKAQREGLERLRDQQQDFDLHRARSQEDEARKIASLYAHGQRAAAEREKEDFARQQRRDREDFNISRQRTLRNNAESTGDISGSADRRSGQIGERAALRGIRSGAAVDLGARATPAIGGSTAAAARQTVAQLTIQGVINLDGKQVASGIWPAIEVLVDNEMAVSLQQIGIPGAGQSAVGGAG